ncbi:acyl-CoA dehydrogenase family protein [Mycobacterium saskatchewanense]|uniref:acyl-CoA dehydrogenase family protein n=1 Tax=Mycobacterium saskatchewanense TaxID=220927 RepID=UPI0021F3AC0F|nr:acyl-CoA dehydrogenase family protein [Mycobacterium saskatchewanense]
MRDDGGWSEDGGKATTYALDEAGWLGVGLPPELGGEGGDFLDAVAVIEAVSAHGWPSPVADVLLVTNALLGRAAARSPAIGGLTVVVPVLATTNGAGLISASARWVPWAPWARQLLMIAADGPGRATLTVVEARHADIRVHENLAGARWGAVSVFDAPGQSVGTLDEPAQRVVEMAYAMGALARSVQLSSALGRVRDLAVHHARQRYQFGRPLAAFQAVQQNLAVLAGNVAAAQAAVRQAVPDVSDPLCLICEPRLAVAKARTSLAADEAARLAHQIHGAIGTTREHELHRHTLALLSWRDEFGSEFYWSQRLADAACGVTDFWEWLCGAMRPAMAEGHSHA